MLFFVLFFSIYVYVNHHTFPCTTAPYSGSLIGNEENEPSLDLGSTNTKTRRRAPNLEKKGLEDEIVLVGGFRAVVLEVVEPPHHSGVDERQELYLERRQHAGRVARPPKEVIKVTYRVRMNLFLTSAYSIRYNIAPA